MDDQRWWTVQELAAYYGKSDQTIRDYIRDGYFPGTRRSSPKERSSWRIPQSAVNHYEKSLAETQINS